MSNDDPKTCPCGRRAFIEIRPEVWYCSDCFQDDVKMCSCGREAVVEIDPQVWYCTDCFEDELGLQRYYDRKN